MEGIEEMASIQVKLTEDDVRNACMDWAVTRILNEGKAVDSHVNIVASETADFVLGSVVVDVETDRMAATPEWQQHQNG